VVQVAADNHTYTHVLSYIFLFVCGCRLLVVDLEFTIKSE